MHFTFESLGGWQNAVYWPQRSTDWNPVDFWLWGYFSNTDYRLKPRTIQL